MLNQAPMKCRLTFRRTEDTIRKEKKGKEGKKALTIFSGIITTRGRARARV